MLHQRSRSRVSIQRLLSSFQVAHIRIFISLLVFPGQALQSVLRKIRLSELAIDLFKPGQPLKPAHCFFKSAVDPFQVLVILSGHGHRPVRHLKITVGLCFHILLQVKSADDGVCGI